jgi:hypothetical protein
MLVMTRRISRSRSERVFLAVRRLNYIVYNRRVGDEALRDRLPIRLGEPMCAFENVLRRLTKAVDARNMVCSLGATKLVVPSEGEDEQ